jgi:hypothetical protein
MHGFFFRAFQQCLDRAPGPNQCEGALANGELFINKNQGSGATRVSFSLPAPACKAPHSIVEVE